MLDILDYIPTGEINAIPSQELADLCGFNSIRDLQQHIEERRCAGAVICSSTQPPGGYYIHSNKYELQSFIRTVENRAKHSLRSIESAKRELARLEQVE